MGGKLAWQISSDAGILPTLFGTCPDMTEKLLTGTLRIKTNKHVLVSQKNCLTEVVLLSTYSIVLVEN